MRSVIASKASKGVRTATPSKPRAALSRSSRVTSPVPLADIVVIRVRLLGKLVAPGAIVGRGFARRGVTLWQRELFVERSQSRGSETDAPQSDRRYRRRRLSLLKEC
jgi:hypothetical protein